MIITGTPGNDTLTGTAGDDTIDALDGFDTVNAGPGNDTVFGGPGVDFLNGELGNDEIHGGDGNDFISGGGGSNTLFGDGGDDTFSSLGLSDQNGTSADGGVGNDVFSTFWLSNTTITTGADSDRIQLFFGDNSHKVTVADFTAGSGGDVLDINSVLSSLTGWNTSTNPFATGFLRLVQNGTDTDLQWDQNGATGGAVWTTFVTLQNVNNGDLTAANFNPGFSPGNAPPRREPVDADINGDNFGDLLLFNDSGDNAIWLMNQNQRQGTGTNLPFNGPTWHVAAVADLDSAGPGFSDIVWQNDNGAVATWQMNGVTVVGQANLPNPGAATHVVDAQDFDGNGGADILLQSDSGQLSLWLMQDATHILAGGQITIGQNPGAPWHAAIGDFNGDGRAGILFTTDSGGTAIWEDYVTTSPGQGHFGLQANLQDNGPTWHVNAVGDFDGDNKDDILWQNDNGLAAIWLMDGAQIKAGYTVAGSEANGPTWHVVDARDTNGDGRDGILWQNDFGGVAVWEAFTLGAGGDAIFTSQLNIVPELNTSGHLDWHVL